MRLKHFIVMLALACVYWAPSLHAESLIGGVGYGQTNIVSTEYKPKSIASTQISATFSHVLAGRWSMMAQYQMDTANVMQGFSGGVFYNSSELSTHGGMINLDGNQELVRVPKWMWRAMVGAGMWQISDTLEMNNPYLGARNKTPVQANMYGLTFGAGLYRFLTDRVALHATASEVVASTGKFALNSSALTFGVFWKYD